MQQLTWLYHVLSTLIYFFVELNPFLFEWWKSANSDKVLWIPPSLKANQHYQKKIID